MIFFTSDLHLHHSNIIGFCGRPFDSVGEMHDAIISNWQSKVRPTDTVYVLGDVTMGRDVFAGDIIRALNGRKILTRGNHDYKAKPQLLATFAEVYDLHEIQVPDPEAKQNNGRQRIVLCHFPLLSWNAIHYGSWHLHGHRHGTLPPVQGVRRLDVGVDCHNFAPLSYDEVKAKMATLGRVDTPSAPPPSNQLSFCFV